MTAHPFIYGVAAIHSLFHAPRFYRPDMVRPARAQNSRIENSRNSQPNSQYKSAACRVELMLTTTTIFISLKTHTT